MFYGNPAKAVAPGGKWNYRYQYSAQFRDAFENFGNWHFGVISKAFGETHPFPFWDNIVMRGGGMVHQCGKNKIHGRSTWFFVSPYGDAPDDHYWIKEGMNWYTNNRDRFEPTLLPTLVDMK